MNLKRRKKLDEMPIAMAKLEVEKDRLEVEEKKIDCFERNIDKLLQQKDRVDISLNEYKKLNDKISELQNEIDCWKTLFGNIQLPYNERIIGGTIKIMEEPPSIRDFTKKYHITFQTEV